jgi:hypothetical protein
MTKRLRCRLRCRDETSAVLDFLVDPLPPAFDSPIGLTAGNCAQNLHMPQQRDSCFSLLIFTSPASSPITIISSLRAHRYRTCSMASVASARYSFPRVAPVATSSTNLDETTAGRPEAAQRPAALPLSAIMNDQWNPNALPFRPGGYGRHDQHFGAFENQLPPQPPLPHPQPWNSHHAQPPPPPPQQQAPMYTQQQSYNDYAAHQQAQAYHQWMLHIGYNAPPPGPPNFQTGSDAYAARPPPRMQPYGMLPPHGQQSYGQQAPYGGSLPFMQHHQHNQHPQMFPRPHYNTMQSQVNLPHGARNEDIQYAFDALLKGLKSKNRNTNTPNRAPTLPGKKPKSGPPSGHAKQKEYGTLHRIASCEAACSRINKLRSTPKGPKASTPAADKTGRYGDEKIMLPAPQPTQEYLDQAAGEPSTIDTPGQLLVILDLNGTVLFRPNRNAKTMIERPFLKPFLRYLFQNFKVMVWSSAKPENVKSLVSQALDNDLRSQLVAQWARDSFGLSPTNYQQNVQVYKNLKLVWSRNQIQSFHPDYETGGRFGQHNTVLIDDSSLKASAQPHNLLEIPEFSATQEQMEGDVLRVVAGYLKTLRLQADVSRFINKEPFKDDASRWSFDWSDADAGGGEMQSKVSAAGSSKKKKNNNKKKQTAAAAAAAVDGSRTNTPLSEISNSLASVSLAASVQKDW